MGQSLVQRSPTECGVSECDREALTVRKSTRGCCGIRKEFGNVLLLFAIPDTNLRHAQ